MDNNFDLKKIGGRIQKFRIEKGMTQEELGEMVGTTQKYISRIENGNNKSYFSTIASIAKALGVPLDSLIADHSDSTDIGNIKLIADSIKGLNRHQLNMLNDFIALIKKYIE